MDKPQAEENDKLILHSFISGKEYKPVILRQGSGCYVTDISGKRYLDMKSGEFNVILGYGNSELIDYILNAGRKLCYSPKSHELQGILASKLIKLLPNFKKVYFGTSGSEAVEVALKISRDFSKRKKIISFWGAFHGTTFGALSCTSDPSLKKPFTPLVPEIVQCLTPMDISPKVELGDEDRVSIALSLLEKQINMSNDVAAIIVEPIYSAGVRIIPLSFLSGVKKIAEKYDIMLISDETGVGYWRVGHLSYLNDCAITPDILILGKGLTSGYLPLSAVLVNKKIAEYYDEHPFLHGQTYTGHPLCCAAAIKTLDIILREKLYKNVEKMGKLLKQKLSALKDKYREIQEVRGKGLLWAIEFQEEVNNKVEQALLKTGVIVDALDFTNTIDLAPPFIISKEEIEHFVKCLENVLTSLQ